MHRTVVLDVVGLTRSLIGPHTPHLKSLVKQSAAIQAITPAVTCTMQSTYLTGKLPRQHGIVGNGWYFRDLSEVWLWRQSNRLVQGEKIWHLARAHNASFTCANTCWWYNMVSDVDYSVTPRPVYCADGRKLPDCYTVPHTLRARLSNELGQFPLFQFWGPAASIASSAWIAKAAMIIEEMFEPVLHLVYLPHLDYILQKVGPKGEIGKDLSAIDALCGELLDFFRRHECRVVLLSEYGITQVDRPIHPNRILRDAGYLAVKNDLGRDYLDCGECRAFAVSDHQIAQVYVQNNRDLPAVKELFTGVPGIEYVLDEPGKSEFGLDHERAGELVLIAQSNSWFTYYFWHDDDSAPDYARTVNIHAKPGYDPCELFIDPAILFPNWKIAWTLFKKIAGFRYLMDVIPLDASLVKGSHGRVTDDDSDGPIFITTQPGLLTAQKIQATDVFSLLLDHVFCD